MRVEKFDRETESIPSQPRQSSTPPTFNLFQPVDLCSASGLCGGFEVYAQGGGKSFYQRASRRVVAQDQVEGGAQVNVLRAQCAQASFPYQRCGVVFGQETDEAAGQHQDGDRFNLGG